jgi:hypothetical protein
MYPMQIVPHPMQLNPENAQEKAKKVAKTKIKKVKVDEEKVEECAVLYDCINKMHPNFHLNTDLDRFPIKDICGLNETVFKKDVSFSIYFIFVLDNTIELKFIF